MDKLYSYDDSFFMNDDDFREQNGILSAQEAEYKAQLDLLYSSKVGLSAKLTSLNNMSFIESHSKELACTIKELSEIARNINNKMKRIDIGTNNITACQKRVQDLLDLQLCGDGVQIALQTEDFETAAGHIHRFLTMDEQLLRETANDSQPGDCDAVTNSVKLLHDATVMLQNKISLHFKEATGVKDISSVKRFFKLFPLVGMKEYGLQQYSKFLCTLLNEFTRDKLFSDLRDGLNGKRANIIFADVITLLFEEVARLLDSNYPLIETFYQAGNLFVVFEPLQKECDLHMTDFLRQFAVHRQTNVIIQIVSEYSSKTGTLTSGSSGSGANPTISQQSGAMEKIDVKNIDILLDEITTINFRFALYKKFILKKLFTDANVVESDARLQNERYVNYESSINRSKTCRLMQELICDYLLLEKYYMEENTKKAISTDTFDDESRVTSLIDDVFFIVRKCIRRANRSSNVDAVCAVINNACATLETDVCNMIRKKLKQGYSSGYLDLTQAYNVMIQGRFQQQTDNENNRLLFLGHLNNTEMCGKYADMLCQAVREEISCSDQERDKLDSCLSSLSNVKTAFKALNEYGLQQLHVTVIKSRIVPSIESFSSFNHLLTPDEFSAYEADEPFSRTLITNLDTLLAEFKPRLTNGNYESFVSLIVSEVIAQLEKVILTTEFSRMGGLALDKEIRNLISYLNKATSWSVRDKFGRLIQIATVLNMEKVSEVTEYWNVNSDTFEWKLTPSDIRQVLQLRKDFRAEDIKRLKF